MQNKIRNNIGYLMTQATKVDSGVTQLAATLDLIYAVNTDVAGKHTLLNAADNAHKAAGTLLKTKRGLLVTAVQDAQVGLQMMRDNLKPRLGTIYSAAWNAAGFMGNLRIPGKVESLVRALQSMKGYLTGNPIPDAGPLLTSARAGVLHDNLTGAIAAVTAQEGAVDQAKQTRDAAAKKLEQALRSVLHELHEKLDPMDAQWLDFGFNKPGQKQAPSAPEGLVATKLSALTALLKWEKAARADHYRLWKRVVGTDEAFTHLTNSSDLAFTLENLPPGVTIEVALSAVNNGGESALSKVAVIQTT